MADRNVAHTAPLQCNSKLDLVLKASVLGTPETLSGRPEGFGDAVFDLAGGGT